MSEYRRVKTYHVANWICFIVGMAVVGATAHGFLPILGAIIASLHFTLTADSAAGYAPPPRAAAPRET